MGVVIGHSLWPIMSGDPTVLKSVAGPVGAANIPFVIDQTDYKN